jgi:hypothetical protein
VRLLQHLVPKPDIAFIVDADPEAAHIRKPEYPLEFVRKNRDSYIRLSRLVRGMIVLPPLPVEELTAKVQETISQACLLPDIEQVDLQVECAAGTAKSKTPNA